MVSLSIFDRLIRLWEAAARRPALVFVGDFRQLRPVEQTRACDSGYWRHVHVRELHTMRRCKCEQLKWKLELLRAHAPDKTQLADIIRGHRAPKMVAHYALRDARYSQEPSELEIGYVFEEQPATTFVTISRLATAWVNDIAVRHFFRDQECLGIVPADPENNPDNFEGTVQVRWKPLPMKIYKNMRVAFTRNVRPDIDQVNGMEGTVLGMDRTGVLVATNTGHTPKVFPWTEPDWGTTFYPIRPAYATTLMKVQGDTLQHMTLYLDTPGVQGAGYVALSRVQYDKDWQFVGHLTPSHFQPADM